MRRRFEWGANHVANLVDERPRVAAFGNLCVQFAMGLFMGCGLFIMTWNFTSQFDKPWVYAINTLLAMMIKVAVQWFVVLVGTPFVAWIAREIVFQRTGVRLSRTAKNAADSPLANSMTVTALATMILTTELSKGNTMPIWFIDSSDAFWAIMGVVMGLGSLTALLEGLSVPSLIYALVKNGHPYQDNASQQAKRKRNHRNRANRQHKNRR